MTPAILCARPSCTRPHTLTCRDCNDRLCVHCYGAGSSTKCARCFRHHAATQAATEERRREAASQAASW